MKSMRMMNLVVAILLVVGLLPVSTPVAASSSSPEWKRGEAYVPGEVVVSFAEGLPDKAYTAQASALAGSVGAMVSQRAGNLAVLQFDEGADVPALVEMVNASGMAAQAQPNYIYAIPETAGTMLGNARIQTEYHAGNRPNSPVLSMSEVGRLNHLVKSKATPLFPGEFSSGGSWGWDYAQFDLVWPAATSSSYKVCVVDTGIDYKHPDLTGMVTNLYDYVNDDTLPNDDNGHGTAVAGVISAKLNNGATTAMGASGAQLYAVKSLNYEGVGTTYTVTAGVYKCANQSGVKILNLSWSMGSDQDEMLYRALYYAIVTKGQLVVAAAGNNSSSDPEYPAGWANPTYNNMTIAGNLFYDPAAKVAPKQKVDASHKANVAAGIISVAAGRPVGDYDVWVDLDQDAVIDSGETFNSEKCATGFTNYGAWVSMAAPGESIYTTTPTSYPFYLNYEGQANTGYDYFSGTSFAAPFVAAAAARYWTANTTKAKDAVKTWLTTENNGEVLDLAVDDFGGVDPTLGYQQDGGNGIQYGYYEPVTGDPVYNAPFCWPTNTAPFGANQNMAGKPYLNAAKMLGRGGLWAAARFAADGSPAVGAVISAYDTTSSTTATLRDSSKLVNLTDPWVMLINLPAVTAPKVTVPETPIKPIQYKLGVSLSGYTSSTQYFNGVSAGGSPQLLYIAPGDFGSVSWNQVAYYTSGPVYNPNDHSTTNLDDYNTVSLAPSTHFRAVLDWKDKDIAGNTFTDTNYGAYPNLDMYLWLPVNAGTSTYEGIIGPNLSHWNLSQYHNYGTTAPNLDHILAGEGTMQDPLLLDPSGLFFTFSPWAQYFFDGGYTPSDIADSTTTATVDYLAIKSGSSLSVNPFLRPKYTNDKYYLRVTDYNKDADPATGSYVTGTQFLVKDQVNDSTHSFVAPVVRLWSKGVLVADVRLQNSNYSNCGSGGGNNNDWWNVLNIDNTIVSGLTTTTGIVVNNDCFTGHSGLPYEDGTLWPK